MLFYKKFCFFWYQIYFYTNYFQVQPFNSQTNNRPDLSKHRKRKVGGLCAETLRSHSQRLFGNLQCVFWNLGTWVKFKSEVELLAKSLAKYADMLSSKRVAMSLIHSSQQPVRSVGNSMSVLYIAPRHSPSSDLAQISSAISDADSDIPVDLQEFLPSDRRRRFDRLESLKKGLDIPIVLLTYRIHQILVPI